jgi:hypothetical protein
MCIIQARIKDPSRAYYFITEYDIKQIVWTEVDTDTFPEESARRFLAGFLLNILEAQNQPEAIACLVDRIASFSGGGTSTGSGIAGHVSIVDVFPTTTGTVGTKVYSQGNNRLESATSDTDKIRVYVKALPGPTNYLPNITVNGSPVTLTELPDKPLWEGYVDITLPLDGIILAEHEDGAIDVAVVELLEGPEILTAVFTNGYPIGQTELKENDTFKLSVTTDVPITRIQILNSGALKADNFTFTATTNKVITVTIANRGNTAVLRAGTIIAYDANGFPSAQFNTSTAGSTDGTHLLLLNNLYPTITFGSVTYPPTQQALKDSESATIGVVINNADTVAYSSPSNQLSVTNPNTIEITKTVTRIGGTYNVSSNNLTATANRAANNASTTSSTNIKIANTNPSVSASHTSRLRSGGNSGTSIQNHTITINSNQLLLSAPTMNETLGAGTFIGSWAGSGSSFSRILQVHDNDPKGTFNWLNFSATNLAGKTITTINTPTYVLGGFVYRDIYFPVIDDEEPIGVSVSNISKVVALDKDLVPMTYQGNLNDGTRVYTITGPSQVVNVNGSNVYWADRTEVNNNTTGGAFIRIEETV